MLAHARFTFLRYSRKSVGLIKKIILFTLLFNPFHTTDLEALIAQLGEHQTLDRKVAGSILTWGGVLCP